MLRILFVVVLSTFICFLGSGNCNLIIDTKLGKIKGKYKNTINNRTFSAFTGIPYAKPPIGGMRYEPAVPISSWVGILEATAEHNVCPQPNIFKREFEAFGDEDCLYLNVYTPKIKLDDETLHPVLFYIHGGSFYVGGGAESYVGPDYLLDRNVVLVTVNYRLGSLGFISFLDETTPGNNGLKDQVVAMNWVVDNIRNFGGDSERITAIGNSAGAVLAHLHTFSSLTKYLVNSAIIESGTAFFLNRNDYYTPVENAYQLGQCAGCNFTNTTQVINCLKSVELILILECEARFTTWSNESAMPFRPVIETVNDGAYITQNMLETVKSEKSKNIPILMGVVPQESSYKTAEYIKTPHLLDILNTKFDELVPEEVGINLNKKQLNRIRQFYFEDKNITTAMKSEITDLFSDGLFLRLHDLTVHSHVNNLKSPIYQYLFEYQGSLSYISLITNDWTSYGVGHTDELFYLFPRRNLFTDHVPSESDRKMISLLTTMWVNFAATGNPTPQNGSLTTWTPVLENFEYLHIQNFNNVSVKSNMFEERMSLWREFVN